MTTAASYRVPDELMDRLHRANERFHVSRQDLERWMDSWEFRHQERVDAAEEQFRQAEREVEDVTEQIRRVLANGPS